VRCIGDDCDNIRPAQRALQYFKNQSFLQHFCGNELVSDLFIKKIIPALYKNGTPSWNPTVNKMTALALLAIKVLLI
jgi:hypothetical protein